MSEQRQENTSRLLWIRLQPPPADHGGQSMGNPEKELHGITESQNVRDWKGP